MNKYVPLSMTEMKKINLNVFINTTLQLFIWYMSNHYREQKAIPVTGRGGL
jgi:hypothetical protein